MYVWTYVYMYIYMEYILCMMVVSKIMVIRRRIIIVTIVIVCLWCVLFYVHVNKLQVQVDEYRQICVQFMYMCKLMCELSVVSWIERVSSYRCDVCVQGYLQSLCVHVLSVSLSLCLSPSLSLFGSCLFVFPLSVSMHVYMYALRIVLYMYLQKDL